MRYQPIEEMDCYILFEEVTRWVWNTVGKWDYFAKRTVGEQLVTAMDSVNANLVEGDGRYSTGDSIRFLVIGRASAREARLWIIRAIERDLCDKSEGEEQIEKIIKAAKLLNMLINYRRKTQKGKSVREELASYGAELDPLDEHDEWP